MLLSPHIKSHRRQLWLAAALALALTAAVSRAERLPLKYYTSADGLAYDYVSCVEQDSRGFLWICTSFGLSRFDGARFVNYRDQEGLMSQVNDLLETRDHVYWVATNGGGVYRMDQPSGARAPRAGANNALSTGAADPGVVFTQYPVGDSLASMRVNVLHEDRNGTIWAGTDAGLFHLEPGGLEVQAISLWVTPNKRKGSSRSGASLKKKTERYGWRTSLGSRFYCRVVARSVTRCGPRLAAT